MWFRGGMRPALFTSTELQSCPGKAAASAQSVPRWKKQQVGFGHGCKRKSTPCTNILQPDQTPEQRAHLCTAQVLSCRKVKTEATSSR